MRIAYSFLFHVAVKLFTVLTAFHATDGDFAVIGFYIKIDGVVVVNNACEIEVGIICNRI